MNKEELIKELKKSRRQTKDERYEYINSHFNQTSYAMRLEKYARELYKENKELHNKIDKAIEYMNGEEFFLLMNSVQTPDKAVCEDYFKAKRNLLKILKDSDVDE